MVIMMLDQSERKCLSKNVHRSANFNDNWLLFLCADELGSYIVDVDDPIAVRARSILEDWHGNGV